MQTSLAWERGRGGGGRGGRGLARVGGRRARKGRRQPQDNVFRSLAAPRERPREGVAGRRALASCFSEHSATGQKAELFAPMSAHTPLLVTWNTVPDTWRGAASATGARV